MISISISIYIDICGCLLVKV